MTEPTTTPPERPDSGGGESSTPESTAGESTAPAGSAADAGSASSAVDAGSDGPQVPAADPVQSADPVVAVGSTPGTAPAETVPAGTPAAAGQAEPGATQATGDATPTTVGSSQATGDATQATADATQATAGSAPATADTTQAFTGAPAEPVAAGAAPAPPHGAPPQGTPQWGPPGAWGAPPQGGYPPPGGPQQGYGPYGPPPGAGQWPQGATGQWPQGATGQWPQGGTGQWPQGAAGQWPPPGSPPGPPGPRRTGRGPLWIGIGVLAVIVVLVAVVVGVNQLGGGDPDDAVSSAVDDMRDWEGITYRGEVRQYSQGDITIDLTVDRNGDAVGTLSRPDGARAEYARLNGVELFKGEAGWWRGDARETDKVQRLAGVWVRNATSEVSGLANQTAGPEKVASDLMPAGIGSGTISVYRETGTRDVAGENGRVLEGIARKVIVSQDGAPRILAVVPMLSETPLAVSRAEPAALAGIGDQIQERDNAPDYIKALTESPKVATQLLNAAPVCSTAQCTATVRVTNTSRFDARGSIQVLVNGQAADFETFQLGPNQSRDIPVSVRNPAAATPGQTVPIRWEAKVNAY